MDWAFAVPLAPQRAAETQPAQAPPDSGTAQAMPPSTLTTCRIRSTMWSGAAGEDVGLRGMSGRMLFPELSPDVEQLLCHRPFTMNAVRQARTVMGFFVCALHP
jgi:hypothetical protein